MCLTSLEDEETLVLLVGERPVGKREDTFDRGDRFNVCMIPTEFSVPLVAFWYCK